MLSYLNNTNRPWNITNVTVRRRAAGGAAVGERAARGALTGAPQDALQPTGFKKPQIQRALDALAESGRCLCTARGPCCAAALGALLRRGAR